MYVYIYRERERSPLRPWNWNNKLNKPCELTNEAEWRYNWQLRMLFTAKPGRGFGEFTAS